MVFDIAFNIILDSHNKQGGASRRAGGRDERPPNNSPFGASEERRRWVPPSHVKRDAHPRDADDLYDGTFRKVRAILNKLTPEKFDKLSLELLNVGISSQLVLKGIILLIFEKALDEPKYSRLYAQLCHRLDEDAPNFEPPSSETTTFRRLLLNKCRDEFENRSKATEAFDKDVLTPDEVEQLLLAKHKMLGNIKFIGELGKLDMLHEGILHKCIKQLLEKKKHTEMRDMGEDLECLCQIMRTTGARLDTDKAKAWMDQYFERMKRIRASPELPARIGFMLQDVIELRAVKWQPRKNGLENGPRTITQVRQEAAKDYGIYYPAPGEIHIPPGPPMTLFERQVMNGGGGRAMPRGGMHDVFSNTMPGFMGNGEIGTGPGVIHMDPYGGYSTNMGRNRALQPGFTGQFGRGGPGKPRHDNQAPREGGGRGGTANFYNNRQQQQQQQQQREGTAGRELPPRFRKQQQQQGVPSVAAGPVPIHPPRPDEVVPINQYGPGGLAVNNAAPPREEISLRPAKNFTVLKPNGPSMLPKGGQGYAQPTPLTKNFIPPEPTIITKQPNNISIKQVSGDNKTKSQKKTVSLSELQTAVEELVKIYLDTHDTNTAITTFKDLRAPRKLMPDAVSHMIQQTLNKTDEDRDSVSELVAGMKEQGLISSDHFIEAFSSILDKMSDLETDVPLVRSYTARLGAQGVVQQLVTLADIAEPMANGAHYPLFLLVLQQIHKLTDKKWLTDAFNTSKINLQQMLPECERSKDRMMIILEDRGLSFMFPLLRVQAELWKQIQAQPNPAALFKWIRENLDIDLQADKGFINTLISSLLRYVTNETTLKDSNDDTATDKLMMEQEKDMLSAYQTMLQTFLHERQPLQLVAIYALQVHCHSNKWPKGMLLRMFVLMYDLEIIEEEAFLKWKEEVNDEFPGKGKALFQVNQWLTWLEQAEEESEEEDE